MIDRMRAWDGEGAGRPPIMRFLGITVRELEEGRTVMAMEVRREMENPMGTIHGGIFCDLADAAMGFTYASTLDEGESFTTLELKANYLKPVRAGQELVATARMVKAGRTTGLVECDVRDEGGALVARVSSTCLTLRGAMADGRGLPGS